MALRWVVKKCELFSFFQPVLHNWCNKGHVCGIVHVKDSLLLRVAHEGNVLFNHALNSLWSEMKLHGKSVRSWCDGSSDRSFMGCGPIELFLVPVSASRLV